MGWCRQATSHYLNQCWPRSLPPYVVTRPQWVNTNEWKILASRGAAVTIKWCPFCTDTIFRIHQQQIPQSQSRTSWCSHTSTSNKLSYNRYQDRFNCQDLLLWWTDVSLQIGPGCSWNSLFVGLCQRPYLPDKYGSQAEPWWRASIWRSHRKVVIKQCSYHNNIIDIQNRLPYSKVVYPAIIVLCLMEVNHGVRTGPDYPFR